MAAHELFMTYEMNAVTDRIDARISILAAKGISGEMTEMDARWAILAALAEVAPWDAVARSTPEIDPQLRADLSASLYSLIESKAVEPNTGGLDLRYAVNTGGCGWARQLARSAVPSRLRDIRNLDKKTVSVDPLTNATDELDGSRVNSSVTKAFHNHSDTVRSAAEELDEMAIEDLRESFSEAAAGARATRRLHLSAKALRAGYALPEAIRPESFLEREWIRLELLENHDLARISAASFLALSESVEDDDQQKIDSRLLYVWDDYTPEQLETLTTRPASVAHMIMLSAVSGQPKPSRDVIDETVGIIVTATGNDVKRADSRAFRPIARQLVASWTAVECEAVSDFNTKTEASVAKSIQRMNDAFAWPEIAATVAALPGAPLGSTMATVSAWVASAIGAFSSEPAFEPAAVIINA